MTEPWDKSIVSPDRIPIDIKDEIDGLFPQSESRRKIAYALMFWDRKPNTKEQNELGTWAGYTGGTATHKVLLKLKEVGLFTDTVGSVPLSRSLLDIAVEKQREQMKHPSDPTNLSAQPKLTTDKIDESLIGLPTNKTEIPVIPVDLPPEYPPTSLERDMDNRIKATEDQVKLLERTTAAGFEDIKKLIGDMTNPLEAAPRANPLTVDPPEEMEVEVEPVNPVPVEEEGPFAGMSKKAVIDLAVNDPEALYALRHGYARSSETIMAMPETMRWMGVMMTTYTQNAFERSVSDGYEGSFSDFLNDCVYQYFADRGKVLQWADMPTPGRMPFPERRLRGG